MLDKILKVLIYSTIFLVPVFFLPLTFEVLEFSKLYVLFCLVWLSVLVWFLKMIVEDKEVRFRYSVLDYLVLAFLAVAIVSSVFSVDRVSSIFGYYGRFSAGLAGLLSLGAFYFLIVNNLGNVKRKAKNVKQQLKTQNIDLREEGGTVTVSGVVKALLCSGVVVMFFVYFSLFGVWVKLASINNQLSLIIIRNLALRVSPVAGALEGTAMFLVVLVILAVIIILGSSNPLFLTFLGRESENPKKKKVGWSVFSGIFILLATVLLMVADFNSAWIILALALIALVVLILRRRVFQKEVHRLILPIALIIISVLFLILNFRTIVATFPNFVLNSSPGFLAERSLSQSESWSVGVRAATSNFKQGLIGSGTGTFFYDFSKFKPSILNEGFLWSIRFDRSGSAVAEILATMGFLGLFSFLALLGFMLWMILGLAGILKPRFIKAQRGNGLDVGTSLLLTLFLVVVLIQFLYYQLITLAFLFWLFLALVIGWQGVKTSEEEQCLIKAKQFRLKDYVEMALVLETVLIVLFLAFLVLCFFGFKSYLADVKYVKALNTPDLDAKSQFLQEAIRLSPRQARYQMVLSKVFLVKAQNGFAALAAQGEQDEIIENLRVARLLATSATNIAPNQVAAWQNLAELYQSIIVMAKERSQFIDLAIEASKKAIILEPKNPKFYLDIGNLYLLLNETEEAKAEFEKAAAQKIDYAPAQIALALMLENEGNTDEAIRNLELLLVRNPNSAEGLFQLGRLYYNNGEVERAITQFKAALVLNQYYSNARFSLAIAYEKQGKIDEALRQLETVLAANPDNEELKARIQRLKRGVVQPEEEMERPGKEKAEGALEGGGVLEETE